MGYSDRWLDCVEPQDCLLGLAHGREPGPSERPLHLTASETGPQTLLGLPQTDDVQRIRADGTVVSQLSGRSSRIHDQLMRSVVGASEFLDLAAEAGDEKHGVLQV